jgi:hypothetical protein
MNLNFFAAASDQPAVLDLLFSSTDVRVLELHSNPGAELRAFLHSGLNYRSPLAFERPVA